MTISIIIPSRQETDALSRLLLSLLPQLSPHDEIIVADYREHSGHATNGAALPAPVTRLRCPRPGRAAQMNYAAALARGEVLWFLHADTQVPIGAVAALRRAMATTNWQGGSCVLHFRGQRTIYRWLGWFTRWNSPLWTFGDQGIFVRAAAFWAVGSYPDWPLLEDVALQHRLRRRGAFGKLPTVISTSVRRFERTGPTRQALLNAAIVVAYYMGVAPVRLARWYAWPLRRRAARPSAATPRTDKPKWKVTPSS